MPHIFRLGAILLLAASCASAAAAKTKKRIFDETAINMCTNFLTVDELAKVTQWVADFGVQHCDYNMKQFGDAITEFAKANWTRFCPVAKLPLATGDYNTLHKCLQEKGTDIFKVLARISPAAYDALREPFTKTKAELCGLLKQGKPAKEVIERAFEIAQTFAKDATFKDFVQKAKCNLNQFEYDCSLPPLKKYSHFARYDDVSYKCGKCISG